jgi:PAS domain S-box-containing protein
MMKQNPIEFREGQLGTLTINNFKETSFLDLIPFAIYTTDDDGKINYYNPAATHLLGGEPKLREDLSDGSFEMRNRDGTKLSADKSPMAICLKNKKSTVDEIVIARPDGSLRNVNAQSYPLFDESGEMKGAFNLLQDITDLKNAETALRETEKKFTDLASTLDKKIEEKILDLKIKHDQLKSSEERYHKMVEEVEDYAIILLDKDGIIQNWNKGAEKIKGYSDEEIIGKSFYNFYLPEDRQSGLPQKLLAQARENGKAIHEGWRLRKDGSRFWGSIVLTAVHDKDNNIIGFSKVTRDLTERKTAEDKMEEYTNQLEFQNKELEQFAYAASHDMKEPLRKIHLYNSSIYETSAHKLDDKAKEYLNRSINAARRMNDLIEDLLTYSKTTSTIENFEEVNLNEVVDEILLVHREEFEQKEISIAVDKLPVLFGVGFQLKQLLFNLINNSIKYKHPDRNVRIEIKNELIDGNEIKEWIADPKHKYHKITLQDNGVGFEPQYSERIFDIFQRLNNSPSAKGSGIGLAICKRIVQNHHGFIKATGKLNGGASFEIFLPADL